MTFSEAVLPSGYGSVLEALKDRGWRAQVTAHRTVNTQLIQLHGYLGHEILVQRERQG